jgi:hypothetical protein
MVCLCGIAIQKNLLSEFEILGTVKIKTGPSMNFVVENAGKRSTRPDLPPIAQEDEG